MAVSIAEIVVEAVVAEQNAIGLVVVVIHNGTCLWKRLKMLRSIVP
ncbi:hypothetical protein Slin_0779 [Spirosoma linguale DSM 74]|uniref:Uncharacterized protein n=1 Tax=Spirosoma linguale (strain ATCC 33905 / DSM 74 / LMG 10896 / Claus 1) TaxID=504472 RepID=D2QH76_SPILD|nr:hypothetical protein Slin_0779 [Spirosoma linguale DSM 74]